MNRMNPHNKLQPQSPFESNSQIFHNVSGIEKADIGEYGDAIREFTTAIELNPMDAKSYFNRATLKVRIGDLEGAREDFKMAENCHRNMTTEIEEYPLL
jgi:Flp pilus assembly protein TadD